MRVIWLIMIVALYCFGCQDNKVEEISISNPAAKEVKLSDLVDTLIYVPLDGSIPISHIHRIRVADSLIVVSPVRSEILSYTMDGHFKAKIGKLGRGPGEYSYCDIFDIDEKDNSLLVLNDQDVMKYDLNGSYQGKITVDASPQYFDLSIGGDYLYAFEPVYGYSRYNWVVSNKDGKLMSTKENAIPMFNSRHPGHGNVFTYKQKSYYSNCYNDTIFSIENNDWEPAYVFAKNDYKNEHEDKQVMFFFYDMVKSKNKLFMNYFLNSEFYTSYYDDRSNETVLLNKANTMNHAGSGAGIINDYDGGVNFVPKYIYTHNGEEYLVSWIYAYELTNKLKEAKTVSDIYNRNEKALRDIASTIKENDNPIILLARIK